MDFQVERIFKGPGFAETLYLGIFEGQRVIRKASNPDAFAFSRTALFREIRLLQNIKDELKPFFPEVLSTNIEEDHAENSYDIPDVIYYDMPYYSPEDGWANLSSLLLEGEISCKDAWSILGDILDTAFMYFQMDDRKPEEDYAEKTMLCAIRESLAWANSDNDFRPFISQKNIRLNGKTVLNVAELEEYFQDSSLMRSILTPSRDRFLHGDFFPENILYNCETKRWILLDPVSVRGVHRGDFTLDLNKMGDWLSGELPALRIGQFSVDINGNNVNFAIHNHSGKLANLQHAQLSEWYNERLKKPKYTDLFLQEPGWKLRYIFIKAFYSFCMLPLADKKQAFARYFLALKSMNDFTELL